MTQVVDAQVWIILALFFGTIFVMALVTSLPRDSRGAVIAGRVLQGALALGFAWYLGKDLVS